MVYLFYLHHTCVWHKPQTCNIPPRMPNLGFKTEVTYSRPKYCHLHLYWIFSGSFLFWQKKSKTWYPIILLKQTLISIVCLIASTSANITAIISNVTTTPVDIEVDRFPFIIKFYLLHYTETVTWCGVQLYGSINKQ